MDKFYESVQRLILLNTKPVHVKIYTFLKGRSPKILVEKEPKSKQRGVALKSKTNYGKYIHPIVLEYDEKYLFEWYD